LFPTKISKFQFIQEIPSGHISHITSLATSPNGEYLISSSYDKKIKIWKNTNNFKKNNNEEEEKKDTENIVNNNNNENIILPSFNCEKTLTGHSNEVNSVKCAYLNNRNKTDLVIVSGSYDKTIKMWSVETGECRWTGGGHSASVKAVAISTERNNNNDRTFVASGGYDKTIQIWNAEEEQSEIIYPIKTITNAYNIYIFDISFHSESSNNHVTTIGIDKIDDKTYYSVVKIFDIQIGELISTMKTKHPFDGLLSLSARVITSPCNKYILSSSENDNKIIIHDIRSGECVHQINNNYKVSDIKLINDDYIVSTSYKSIKIFNYKNNQLIKSLNIPSNQRNCAIAVDPLHNNYIISAEYTHKNPTLFLFSD
jgi:WD40 repeat protein